MPFKFVLDQGDGSAPIVIVRGDATGGGFGSMDLSRRPQVMTLEPANANIGVESVAGRVAHELGHSLGLAQARSSCGTSSLMSDGATIESGERTHNRVTPNDVAAVSRNYFRQGECTVTYQGGSISECTDFDRDGVTSCAGDCNDHDSAHSTNCGSGCDLESCWSVEGCTECDLNICRCSQVWGQPFSPVLLDVEGDGFALTGRADGVRFDLNNDGRSGRVSWTGRGSDDAWLSLDRNGNGRVDSGAELFGDQTPQPPTVEPHGFLALAEYDRQAGAGGQRRRRGGRAGWRVRESEVVAGREPRRRLRPRRATHPAGA